MGCVFVVLRFQLVCFIWILFVFFLFRSLFPYRLSILSCCYTDDVNAVVQQAR